MSVKRKTTIKSVKAILVGRLATYIDFVTDVAAGKCLDESHTLLYRGKELFPIKDIKAPCEFQQGIYKFPFDLTIPGAKFNVACISSGLHDAASRNSAMNQTFMLPPSFEYRGAGGHGKIEYFVKAMIEPWEGEGWISYTPFNFSPKGDCTSFRKSHSKAFLESSNECELQFQYEDCISEASTPPTPTTIISFGMPDKKPLCITIPSEKRSSIMSRFRLNLCSSSPVSPLNQINLPMLLTFYGHSRRNKSSSSNVILSDFLLSLMVEYNHTIQTNFDSKGVIKINRPLCDSLGINIISRDSPEEFPVNELKVISFLVKLVSLLAVTAERVTHEDLVKNDQLLKQDKPMMIQAAQFHKVTEFCQTRYVCKIDRGLYRIEVEETPSFEVCNMRNDYQLVVFMDIEFMGQHKLFRLFLDAVLLK